MRYCIAFTKGREKESDELALRIRRKGHSVRFISTENKRPDIALTEFLGRLKDSDDILVLVPAYGMIRKFPKEIGRVGKISIESGVYGL